MADTPQKLKEAWAARSSFLEGIEEQTKLLDECDVVVPVTKIPDYVVFADQLAKEYDFRLQSFGHAGDGNLHIYTCSNDMEREEFLRQVDDFMTKLYAKTMELGGQISGEHGTAGGKSNTWPRPQGYQHCPDAGHQGGVRPQNDFESGQNFFPMP